MILLLQSKVIGNSMLTDLSKWCFKGNAHSGVDDRLVDGRRKELQLRGNHKSTKKVRVIIVQNQVY